MRSLRMAAAAAAALTAFGLGLSACGTSGGGGGGGGNSIVDKAKNSKVLNIGVKPDQPGLGLQSSSGQYSGFDVDVARYVAKKLGATKINFVPTLSARSGNWMAWRLCEPPPWRGER